MPLWVFLELFRCCLPRTTPTQPTPVNSQGSRESQISKYYAYDRTWQELTSHEPVGDTEFCSKTANESFELPMYCRQNVPAKQMAVRSRTMTIQ